MCLKFPLRVRKCLVSGTFVVCIIFIPLALSAVRVVCARARMPVALNISSKELETCLRERAVEMYVNVSHARSRRVILFCTRSLGWSAIVKTSLQKQCEKGKRDTRRSATVVAIGRF